MSGRNKYWVCDSVIRQTQRRTGDQIPLYDVANLFFWREESMAPAIRHIEDQSSGLSQWRERLLCYQLRIGLQELYATVTAEGPGDVAWLTTRCMNIIAAGA